MGKISKNAVYFQPEGNEAEPPPLLTNIGKWRIERIPYVR